MEGLQSGTRFLPGRILKRREYGRVRINRTGRQLNIFSNELVFTLSDGNLTDLFITLDLGESFLASL